MTEERRKSPQPLTQEQLEWVVEQTHLTAERAGREGARGVRKWATIGYVTLVLGLIFVQQVGNNTSEKERSAIVDSGRAVSVDGCNRDYREDVRIRDVFLTSQSIVKARLKAGESPDPANDRKVIQFYDAQLAAFELPDCRKAESLLTSDPDKFVPNIDPFYEGSPDPNLPKSVYDKG